jgi:uroporphyrinogen-III decarboxylase
MKMELIRRLKEKWGNSVLICASVAAPFTGVSLLFGIQEQMLLFYDDVSLLRDTIEFTKRLSVECSKKLIDSGADLIWFGDCAASSKFIDIGKFGEFVFEPTRDAISQIKAFGGMVIYHAGENNIQHIESMSMLGAEIVNCAEHADMSLLYDAAKENCCMMGNLDPIRGIMNGTPDSIKELIRNQKAMMKNREKYIINTGEGIPVVTPENNVIALFSAILDNE